MQKAAKYLRKKTASVKRTRANFAQVEGQTRHKNLKQENEVEKHQKSKMRKCVFVSKISLRVAKLMVNSITKSLHMGNGKQT